MYWGGGFLGGKKQKPKKKARHGMNELDFAYQMFVVVFKILFFAWLVAGPLNTIIERVLYP